MVTLAQGSLIEVGLASKIYVNCLLPSTMETSNDMECNKGVHIKWYIVNKLLNKWVNVKWALNNLVKGR